MSRNRAGRAPTSAEQALTVACPECKAMPGNPCTYLNPVGVGQYNPTPAQQARLDRAGTPTERPHNGRRKAYAKANRPKVAPKTVMVKLGARDLRALIDTCASALIEDDGSERRDGETLADFRARVRRAGHLEWLVTENLVPALWKLTGEWK